MTREERHTIGWAGSIYCIDFSSNWDLEPDKIPLFSPLVKRPPDDSGRRSWYEASHQTLVTVKSWGQTGFLSITASEIGFKKFEERDQVINVSGGCHLFTGSLCSLRRYTGNTLFSSRHKAHNLNKGTNYTPQPLWLKCKVKSFSVYC